MNALQPFFPSRHALSWIEAIYAIPFLGQIQGVFSLNLPDPAPCMGEPLRFGQIRLAPSQTLLCPLPLGYIDQGTHEFNNVAGWTENRMRHYLNVSDLAARTDDSAIQFVARFSADCRLYDIDVPVSIQRMNVLDPLFPGGRYPFFI